MLESGAQFAPEFSGQSGVEGYDEEIFDLGENLSARQIAVSEQNILMLSDLLAKEEDPRVAQDIEIMIKAEQDDIEATRINYERVLPYGNITGLIFAGFRGLLDKQVPYERQQAALVRLKKYTGQAEGYEVFTEQAKARLTERFPVPGLIKPFVGEVEQDLERAPVMIEGLQSVFEATELEGYEDDLALLTEQLTAYNAWVEETILPNTRENAALPRELYELELKNYGVDDSPEALIKTGQVGFMNIRNEMMALAPLVAKQKGYDTNNYREVIRLLKKEQIHGDKLMASYREVMAEIDVIIERESDYAFPAGMWTLAAHEARPGHEMQFTTMLRGGVSTARALFAFNSANVEGWALYAEAITKSYMPLEGQLISLQATAYYYGYENVQALRASTELRLKDKFNQQEFHDFLLAQGLLPPEVLNKAVEENFIAPRLGGE